MKKRILLIEDDRIVRENTAEILQFADYDVITASNGMEGVEKVKKELPDIVLCDIMMPKLDGYAVYKLLSDHSKYKKIPFIFLSAKTDHSDIRKGMELGADDFLTKPFEESELLSAIATRLKKTDKASTYKPELNAISTQTSITQLIREFSTRKSFFFHKGENIFCEGNHSNHIFLIKKGLVKLYKSTEDGKELITGLYGENEFIGFISSFGDFPHTENAEVMEDARIIKIDKKEMLSIIHANPGVAIELLSMLVNSIKCDKNRLIQIAYGSVRGRVANSLLMLSDQQGKANIVISRLDLAKLTGVAKETLIRTLSGFKEDGIIETERDSIKIVDKSVLESIH